MRVVIDMPDSDWARLLEVAEAHGVRLPQLILAAALELMPWRDTLADRVAHLARAGLPDARIAERLDLPNYRVAEMRRDAGIPANRFTRGEGRTTGRKTA
ncbi:hypothetical protein G3H63_09295 [Microbacterium resistens]|uniref:hypothetical protein n=1 Tax=Microbacterium resistens TaxID=156977 RepID=UPI001C565271|nr:hypothetical protein [Microbacterium resistens]MBW1639264.1 hypothetical protein [Microbacterium resistens]